MKFDFNYDPIFEKCLTKLSSIIENYFYETMTTITIVKSILNFGLYFKENLKIFKENENFNKYASDKLIILICNLNRHIEERFRDKKSPYAECISNTFDIILVSHLYLLRVQF